MLGTATGPIVGPSDPIKLAKRMLAAAYTVGQHLPFGCIGSPSLEILLQLFVLEYEAEYPKICDLNLSGGVKPKVAERWISALRDLGLVDRRDDLIALSDSGHASVVAMLEQIYVEQRALD